MAFNWSIKVIMYINAGYVENQDGSIVTIGGEHIYLQNTHSTGFNYCVFTSSGSLTVLRSRDIFNCSILIVGGGGSGGGNQTSASGGGGGAGGQVNIVNSVTLVSNTTYTVTVGVGGAQSTISGNSGTSSSWNGQYTAQGGAGGGAGYQNGPYAGNQIPGSGATGVSGGGSGGSGGYYAPGNIYYPSAGINGGFGGTGTYNDFIPPSSGTNDSELQRVRGYFSTGGGGGQFADRWDGGIGYAGGTTPWFVYPNYFLGYSGPYYGAGIGKLLNTPETSSVYNNYSAYSSSSWPKFLGTTNNRIFFGGNGGSGAQGAYTANAVSNGGQDGIVIIKYRL